MLPRMHGQCALCWFGLSTLPAQLLCNLPVAQPCNSTSLYHLPLVALQFDSWDLILALEFLDTGNATHPGVAVHASSGGTQLYT